MSFIEIIPQEFNNLIKLLGLLILGFALGNFLGKLFKLNLATINPNAEYILLFCLGFMAIRLIIRSYSQGCLQS